MIESTTFYARLQDPKLDLRDPRGKRHPMALILMSLLLAILSKRDGCLSSMYRYMKSHHAKICQQLDIHDQPLVSRAQLPLILNRVNWRYLIELLEQHDECDTKDILSLSKKWVSGDGKELRGSIQTGNTRGEASVQIVSHETRQILGQSFHDGLKESEIPAVRELIKKQGLNIDGITLDALHCVPETLSLLVESGIDYVVGLKENQATLLSDMVSESVLGEPFDEQVTEETGHGRQERRSYAAFDVSSTELDHRWFGAAISSLIVVDRERTEIKTKVSSMERSYYLSNIKYGNQSDCHELFSAVRNHWLVESSNWIRDCTFQEDRLRTSLPVMSRSVAICRTIALNLLRSLNVPSLVEKIEAFMDDIKYLFSILRDKRFL